MEVEQKYKGILCDIYHREMSISLCSCHLHNPIVQYVLGVICIKTGDIQFTEE